ncbi:1-acyl-sn-glycerol-3-phosphate acyltransferase [Corynebacterium lowii]|uniref:1-acyl-sn-glycerol-3-phosphate acyltransferase n=1 Tax=Corynebacterium lowii TaxID=1544413 RepID=A0A0Q0Z2L3_9CORY|nr:1-acyl-sn-glycerol-3-phosphate acyltransferase [Corynebacterium lowii]KQB83452.1 1-acyl-sn-glycerol-3-phosphate acyltransferase [Corynebacterium lowii]MDP9852497.1 1-acyl-sn-glycerol-3-phosphate acyltransferase [Corynebacterium lowii]
MLLWDMVYRGIVRVGRVVIAAQGLQMHVEGEDRIPRKGGAILVMNHSGYMDFVLGGYAPHLRGRLVRYMTKASVFDKPGVGTLMRIMGHIPVDRIDGAASFEEAVRKASEGQIVGIFPEATISRSFEIKNLRTGAVRIAQKAEVPIIPLVSFGSQRLWTKGGKRNLGRSRTPIYLSVLEPWNPSGSPEEDTEALREQMQSGLEHLWDQYQRDYGEFPANEFWVPARFGGGAPSPEVAQREDNEVEKERYRIRKLSEDLTVLSEKIKEVSRNLVAGAYEAYDSAQEKFAHSQEPEPAPEPTKEPATEQAQGAEEKEDRTAMVVWLKNSMDELAAEVSQGAREGRDRIAASMEQAKNNAAMLYSQLSSEGWERYEGSRLDEALTRLAAQSKQIVSKLPHRVTAQFSGIPGAIVCNVEGSLLGTDGRVHERDVQALRRAVDDGASIVLTTEFGPDEWRRTAAELGLDTVGVCYDGAVVLDAQGEVLAQNFFAEADAAAVERAVASVAPEVSVEWRTGLEGGEYHRLAGVLRMPEGNLKKTASHLRKELKNVAAVVPTSRKGLHILPAETNKGLGVFRALDFLHITPAQTVAFGAAPSDIPVLEAVGKGVAMADAPSEVLKKASSATSISDEAGVAEVLNPLLDAASEERQ